MGVMIPMKRERNAIRVGVDGISLIGRATQGVRIMRLRDGDNLEGVAKVKK